MNAAALASLAALAPPPGDAALCAAVARLDACLGLGFGRLGAEQHAALGSLGRVLGDTPLGARVKAAVAALRQGEFREGHFLTLAAARAALQGARHDALAATVATALSRPPATATTPSAPPPVEAGQSPLLDSVRAFLMEIALSGLRQLEADTVLPFQATLERLQGEAAHFRLASLLTGLCDELLTLAPTSAQAEIPLCRWADLWTAAALLAVRTAPPTETTKISGELRILGAELRAHRFAVSLVGHGIVLGDGRVRLARVTRSAFKVDAVTGREVLRPLATTHLLRALADTRVLALRELGMAQSGDVLYQEAQVTPGATFDVWREAARFAPGAAQTDVVRGAAPPLWRHPAQLAEPVLLEGAGKGWIRQRPDGLYADLGGVALRIDLARQHPAAEMTADKFQGAQRVLGLLRFDDGRFGVQPLALYLPQSKQQTLVAGASAAQAALGSIAGSAVGILRERASKLLRKKA